MNKRSQGNAPLNVALVGYGLAGAVFHAPLVASTPGLKLAAIVTTSKERSRAARQAYPRAQILTAAQQIWDNAADFDIVVIATANSAHALLATEALQSGLAVVVDKPMCVSSLEAARLIDLARNQGQLLTVFHNRRWDSDFLTVRKLIDSGKLGAITRFESRFERYRPHLSAAAWREHTSFQEGGGLLFDLGSHLIDQCLELFGQPETVYAEVECRRAGAIVDDDTFVALSFANGLRAHLFASSLAMIQGPRFRVNGLLGSFVKYGLDPQEGALRSGILPGALDFGRESPDTWGRLSYQDGDVIVDDPVESLPGTYAEFYSRLRDALVQGGDPPVKPEAGLQSLILIEAALRSAREQQAVRVADLPLAVGSG